MKKLLSGLLLSFLFLPQLTKAEENAYGPNSIRIIHVEMLDEATGGCWTNISEMQRYAEYSDVSEQWKALAYII